MNSILVPVDYSQASRNAFQYAVQIAGQFHARVVVFHAYVTPLAEPYMIPSVQASMMDQQESAAKSFFEELEQSVAPDVLKNIELTSRTAFGPALEEILFLSEEIQPELIVMGVKSTPEFTRAILGSASIGLVQRSPYPLLLVPEEAEYRPLRHIAYAASLEEDDSDAIDKLLDYAFLYKAAIHCIHVRRPEDTMDHEIRMKFMKERYREELTMHNISLEESDGEDIVAAIQRYAIDNQIDMMAMLTHHRGFLGRMFNESLTKKTALHTRIPLLVFRLA